jgi:hypothetical protein
MATTNKAAASRTSVPAKSSTAIREWVVVKGKEKGAFTKAVNQMHADGIRSTDCLSPRGKNNGSTSTKELYADLLLTVQMGMEQEKQALLQKEPKTLSESENRERNEYVKERGSLLKDLRNALKRRENKAAGTPTTQRTPLQIIQDQITGAIERIGNLDPENGDAIPDAMDLPNTTKHLKAALAAFLGK